MKLVSMGATFRSSSTPSSWKKVSIACPMRALIGMPVAYETCFKELTWALSSTVVNLVLPHVLLPRPSSILISFRFTVLPPASSSTCTTSSDGA